MDPRRIVALSSGNKLFQPYLAESWDLMSAIYYCHRWHSRIPDNMVRFLKYCFNYIDINRYFFRHCLILYLHLVSSLLFWNILSILNQQLFKYSCSIILYINVYNFSFVVEILLCLRRKAVVGEYVQFFYFK